MSSVFPDEPNEEERQEELPQDNETPFRPADDAASNAGTAGQSDAQSDVAAAQDDGVDDTHPVTDTNLQPEEQYDEGVSGAAEASEPNAGNAVVGYDPNKDQRAEPPTDTEGQSVNQDDSDNREDAEDTKNIQ